MSVRAVGLCLALASCATSPDYGPLPRPEPEVSLVRSSHPNGTLRRKAETLILADGREVLHGKEERWYSDGTREREASWDRGEPIGILRSWWRDGTLHSELDYADGRSPATWRWFHANGALHGEGETIAGVKTGPWKWFHPNGALSHAGSYERGRRQGAWRFFRDDDSTLAEGAYEAGRRVVPWTFWDETGVSSVRDFDPEGHEARLQPREQAGDHE